MARTKHNHREKAIANDTFEKMFNSKQRIYSASADKYLETASTYITSIVTHRPIVNESPMTIHAGSQNHSMSIDGRPDYLNTFEQKTQSYLDQQNDESNIADSYTDPGSPENGVQQLTVESIDESNVLLALQHKGVPQTFFDGKMEALEEEFADLGMTPSHEEEENIQRKLLTFTS